MNPAIVKSWVEQKFFMSLHLSHKNFTHNFFDLYFL